MTQVHRTLEQLEKDVWSEPDYPSHLVETCHRLRKKPLRDFTTEDLRIMIGQDIGTPFLLPLALDRLEDKPLAAGDFYEGDLLQAVLSRDLSGVGKDDRNRLRDICLAARNTDARLPTELASRITQYLGA